MPPRRLPSQRMCLYLSADLVRQVDAHLVDPIDGERKYGAFSALVTRLLREWLDQHPATPQPLRIEATDL